MEGRLLYYMIWLACFRSICRYICSTNAVKLLGINNPQKDREDLLEFFAFGISAFHWYGHKMKWQVHVHPH